jgi:hypothetical protein
MGLTAATASWLIPSLIAAGGVGVSAYQANQQAKEQRAQAAEAKETALKQQQTLAEKAPEQAMEAGSSDAIKKRKTSYGIQDSIIANMGSNTIGQKETWG